MKKVNSILMLIVCLLLGVSAFLIYFTGGSSFDLIYGKPSLNPPTQQIENATSNTTPQTNNTGAADTESPSTVQSQSIPLKSIKTSYKLSIPRLGLNSGIRTDTVNANYAVYHYPESVQPGENGECGLLGHRTSYTSPFQYLRILTPGDQVFIYDEIEKKKYTYLVQSNGKDIRYDYQINPITFDNGGESRLLLVTCYPPGTTRAAWITHCKLDSVSYYE